VPAVHKTLWYMDSLAFHW